MSALEGTLYAANRAEIIKLAEEKAATYFGTTCVRVRLSAETPHPIMAGFNARFWASVWHDLESRSYGPDRCRGCGKDSWPAAPLNQETN